jgi:hypothetical protein
MDMITSEDVIDSVERYRKDRGARWWQSASVIEAHQQAARAFIASSPKYEDRFSGRGIVICGGGNVLFTNAYVCIRILKHLNCKLPVELWHLDNEVDDRMRQIVSNIGASCINASEIDRRNPKQCRILNGWELKPFSILHCSFEEVLLLDADNVPVVDPTYLFEGGEYMRTGAVFWPDYGRLEPSRQIWDVFEVEYRNEPEVESGQVLVKKKPCWDALQLTMHYNERSDFYYKYSHGDKDTFHMAFRRVGKEYSMPPYQIKPLECTMCQHDFRGYRLFQHRHRDKWRVDGSNKQITDFYFENICRQYLSELSLEWSGRAFWDFPQNEEERELFRGLAGKKFM